MFKNIYFIIYVQKKVFPRGGSQGWFPGVGPRGGFQGGDVCKYTQKEASQGWFPGVVSRVGNLVLTRVGNQGWDPCPGHILEILQPEDRIMNL